MAHGRSGIGRDDSRDREHPCDADPGSDGERWGRVGRAHGVQLHRRRDAQASPDDVRGSDDVVLQRPDHHRLRDRLHSLVGTGSDQRAAARPTLGRAAKRFSIQYKTGLTPCFVMLLPMCCEMILLFRDRANHDD